jgi:hypothetical protein
MQIKRIVICRRTDISTVIGCFTLGASVSYGDGVVVVVSGVLRVEGDARAAEVLFVGYGLAGAEEDGCD